MVLRAALLLAKLARSRCIQEVDVRWQKEDQEGEYHNFGETKSGMLERQYKAHMTADAHVYSPLVPRVRGILPEGTAQKQKPPKVFKRPKSSKRPHLRRCAHCPKGHPKPLSAHRRCPKGPTTTPRSTLSSPRLPSFACRSTGTSRSPFMSRRRQRRGSC
ncbi:unnamed protein product [Symbiodinium microadriaticum]|nr:unnamed protein product [Symbiodinium sp. KB8]CAE7804049.1 unnamed protein product [Symbiodinium microadriaticum]